MDVDLKHIQGCIYIISGFCLIMIEEHRNLAQNTVVLNSFAEEATCG